MEAGGGKEERHERDCRWHKQRGDASLLRKPQAGISRESGLAGHHGRRGLDARQIVQKRLDPHRHVPFLRYRLHRDNAARVVAVQCLESGS